jgi:hypothetical protein
MDACSRLTACVLQVDSSLSHRSNCNHRLRNLLRVADSAIGTTVIVTRTSSFGLRSARLRGDSPTVGVLANHSITRFVATSNLAATASPILRPEKNSFDVGVVAGHSTRDTSRRPDGTLRSGLACRRVETCW